MKNTKVFFGIILFWVLLASCSDKPKTFLNEAADSSHTQGHSYHGKAMFVSDTASLIFLDSKNNSCLKCHNGIEPIRAQKSGMMQAIYKVAQKTPFPDNSCIVCHGGNPKATSKEEAHQGTIDYFRQKNGPREFYPDPGSSWINQYSCGQCHKEQVSAQMNSLMMSEQGKIQGTLWSFGGLEGYQHTVGNYATKNPEDPHKRLGTDKYRAYMKKLHDVNPQVYPSKMTVLPKAPTAEEVEKKPELAAYTYLRQECLRCHTGSKGRQKRGDFRGIGCSSCHIPYSNNGFYEGNDPTIDSLKPGHLLVHSIQSSRDAKVTVHGKTYSGIPVETCTTCHNRGKRIGVSYQGLMETAYSPTYDRHGRSQSKLHTKRYLHLKEDVHYSKGMLCQDCHTSSDMHGDGFLSGATLAPVEIECQDCHGTTTKYPWELPLGTGDEFDTKPASGAPRGVSDTILAYLKQGIRVEAKDGFLLTARGNPFTNVVRQGDSVIVHLASGKDLILPPLKKLNLGNRLSQEGRVAMCQVKGHMDRMECYTCHATWAPQCYGCHVKVDYSNNLTHIDWLAAASDHDKNGLTGGARGDFDKYKIAGEVSETRSYLRWENPPLSQNGEGRISPTIPGCQTTVTVIGKNGEALLKNHIFKIPNVEGAGDEGQLGIDMSPVQPHTIQKKARACESCHANSAALGYGIGGGEYYADPSEDLVIDLMSADKQVLPQKRTIQKPGIPNLHMDWSRFVDEKGTQLQTVGHHFDLSGPLDEATRSKLDRRGVCLSCHQTVPDNDMAISLISHMAKYAHVRIDKKEHAEIISRSIRIGAWVEILSPILLVLFVLWWWRKRRNR